MQRQCQTTDQRKAARRRLSLLLFLPAGALTTPPFVATLASFFLLLPASLFVGAVGFELAGNDVTHGKVSLDSFDGGRFAIQFEAPTLRGIGAVVHLLAIGGFESALCVAAGEKELHVNTLSWFR